MAALGTTLPTMLDLAKMLDPDGKSLAQIVPILNQVNDVFPRIRWQPANGTWSHRSTYHTVLPRGSWTKINGTIAPTVGKTGQSTDGVAEYQDYSQVDPILAEASGNVSAYRLKHDAMHMQGAVHEFMETWFYGNADLVPEEFTGLAPRYAAKFSGSTETAENIILGGSAAGQTDCTSIWILNLSGDGVTGIYRPSTMAGLQMVNKTPGAPMTMAQGDGTYAERLVTHYRWSCGLALVDWRKAVRIANIDTSALTKTGSASNDSDLVDLIQQGIELLPPDTSGETVILGNRTIAQYLRRQTHNATKATTLSWENFGGKRVQMVGELPFLRCDSITNGETAMAVS